MKSKSSIPEKHMPPIYYHKIGKFDYILFNEIPLAKKHRDAFGKWMSGQTCPVVEVNGKEEGGVYRWDYERWYLMRFQNKETYWD